MQADKWTSLLQPLWSWQTMLFVFWKAKQPGLLRLSHTKQLNSTFPCLLFFCLLLWTPKKWIILMSTYSFRSSDRPWKAPGMMVLIKLCLRSLGKRENISSTNKLCTGMMVMHLKSLGFSRIKHCGCRQPDGDPLSCTYPTVVCWLGATVELWQCNKLQMQI